jgi:hypothetical protein
VIQLNDRWFESRQGLGIFLFTTASRPALGPIQPPIQWVPGADSHGVKRPGREAHHSPPSSAEIKNVWSYTSTPQYTFMAWCSVKSTGTTFPFTLLYFTLRLLRLKFILCNRIYSLIGIVILFRCHQYLSRDYRSTVASHIQLSG